MHIITLLSVIAVCGFLHVADLVHTREVSSYSLGKTLPLLTCIAAAFISVVSVLDTISNLYDICF